jgi:glycosyltransferase involved in cell wall biosynthesis
MRPSTPSGYRARVPVVSVVVPAWLPDTTATAFLPAALDALLAQTLTDWEAVVVDDDSPLPVAPLVPEDPRVRVAAHDGNRGLGA